MLVQSEGRAIGIFDRWQADRRTTLVAGHFWAEVANRLLVGNCVDAATTQTYLSLLAGFGVGGADRGLARVADAVDLAARHRLTVYDALYLQLDLDMDATLAA